MTSTFDQFIDTARRDIELAEAPTGESGRYRVQMASHLLGCLRFGGLSDNEVGIAIDALLPGADGDRAPVYRTVYLAVPH